MLGFITLILGLVLDLFRSRATLEAEVLALRHQIIVLRRGRS
jgi:transposase InsO family protein